MRMTAAQYRDMAGLSGDARPAKGTIRQSREITAFCHSDQFVSSQTVPGASASGVFSALLPIPPSLNNAFVNATGKRGRIKSDGYREWIRIARFALPDGPRVVGPFEVTISLPAAMRGDLDNRIKPVLDLLVKAGITADDRHCQSIFVRRSDGLFEDQCAVAVRQHGSFSPALAESSGAARGPYVPASLGT